MRGLGHAYGNVPSLRDVTLAIPPGRFLSLLGPSGCGKTTLLKIIGGYLTPSSGAVFLDGKDVTLLPPEARKVGMVFQNYALFPHLSAWHNVSFGLEVRGVPGPEINRRVREMLARVGLEAEAERRPAKLSGGQQQRVALARAMVIEPTVLLLDEPFANLDRHLRETLRGELRALQRSAGATTILVTHDQEEALALSDHVGVMNKGRLLQVGTPREVYHRPRTPFVASFLGKANLFDGARLGMAGTVMVRPESIVLHEGDRRGTVASLAFLGGSTLAEIDWNGVRLVVRTKKSVSGSIAFRIPTESVWRVPEDDA